MTRRSYRLRIDAHVFNDSGFKVAVIPCGVHETVASDIRDAQFHTLNGFQTELGFIDNHDWKRHYDGAGVPYGLLINVEDQDGRSCRIRYYAREVQ